MSEKEYLDRETVIRKLNEIGGCDASSDWEEGFDKGIEVAVKVAEKLPAAEVAPVKHGEWTTIDGISRCSECGYIPLYDNAIDDLFYSDYCPNCGAKMEV